MPKDRLPCFSLEQAEKLRANILKYWEDQGYDRSQKFAIYRRLESLREYALIDPDTRRVEVYRPWVTMGGGAGTT